MSIRTLSRRLTVATATGALMVSAAWAGTSLAPVSTAAPATPEVGEVQVDDVDSTTSTLDHAAGAVSSGADAPTSEEAPLSTGDAVTSTDVTTAALAPGEASLPSQQLRDGAYWVGATKVDLYPRPDDYGGTWERDADACKTLDEGLVTGEHTHQVAATGSPYPENPNCIYLGGYGLGPMNPAVEFDREFGLWVRTIAISDGAQPLFVTVLDGEGWFWDYASKCDDCGFKQIGQRLGSELGVDPSAFVFHSTHSHTSPDFIGGWGFVPDWYMQQVTDALEQGIRGAVASMEQARVEVGEVLAREQNRNRRDTYHAAEEQGLTWLRAYVPGTTTTTTTAPGSSGGKGNSGEETTTTTPARTIATLGTYAAHPTTVDVGPGIAHPDWPGVFASTLEDRFGGVAMHVMSGLGNMSAAGGTQMGARLADLVPDAGRLLDTTSVATSQETWSQPATNAPLTALGFGGFFDREFLTVPAEVRTGKNPEEAPCVSASPFSVEVAASAASIGGVLAITAGPGEMFSNSTNTIKDRAAAIGMPYAMPMAQANDALGYLPESFERADNPASGEGAGFALSGPAYTEYEDAYSIDRCFGDKNLATTLGLLDGLR